MSPSEVSHTRTGMGGNTSQAINATRGTKPCPSRPGNTPRQPHPEATNKVRGARSDCDLTRHQHRGQVPRPSPACSRIHLPQHSALAGLPRGGDKPAPPVTGDRRQVTGSVPPRDQTGGAWRMAHGAWRMAQDWSQGARRRLVHSVPWRSNRTRSWSRLGRPCQNSMRSGRRR